MPKRNSNKSDIVAAFDSFSKRILQREARNFINKLQLTSKREIVVSDPSSYGRLSHEDVNPSEHFTFLQEMVICNVSDDLLYEILYNLPKDELTALLMDFWYGYKDKEISEHLEVTTRTVHNLRKRAYSTIRQLYGKTEQKHHTNRRTNWSSGKRRS